MARPTPILNRRSLPCYAHSICTDILSPLCTLVFPLLSCLADGEKRFLEQYQIIVTNSVMLFDRIHFCASFIIEDQSVKPFHFRGLEEKKKGTKSQVQPRIGAVHSYPVPTSRKYQRDIGPDNITPSWRFHFEAYSVQRRIEGSYHFISLDTLHTAPSSTSPSTFSLPANSVPVEITPRG